MVKEQKLNKKKVLLAGASLVLLGGLLGAGLHPITKEVIVEKEINNTVEVVKEVPVETIVEVEKIVEVPVNVTEFVKVDNENLHEVLKHIYDNNGNVEYLLDDLDDDEVNMIADRVVLINEFKKLSVDAIEKELFDELDNEEFLGVKFDENDLEKLRIDDDQDEISVKDIDFEDGDARLSLTGTFEQDDVKYDYKVDVKFNDFEFDELDNIEVTLHE